MTITQGNLFGVLSNIMKPISVCFVCRGDGWQWEWKDEESRMKIPCEGCGGNGITEGIIRQTLERPKYKPGEQAESLKEKGMNQVEENAGSEWADYALGILRKVCLENTEFTADAFRDALKKEPHHPNAIGTVFRKANALGWITFTGRVRPSTRPSSHGHHQKIWKSKL